MADINSLTISFTFQGAVTNALVAKWAETGDQNPLSLNLALATTEVTKRILVTNPNPASLVVTDVNVTSSSTVLKTVTLANGPVTIPANGTDVNVPLKFTFANQQALDQVNAVVTLVIQEIV